MTTPKPRNPLEVDWKYIDTWPKWRAKWNKVETEQEAMGLLHVLLKGSSCLLHPQAIDFILEHVDPDPTAGPLASLKAAFVNILVNAVLNLQTSYSYVWEWQVKNNPDFLKKVFDSLVKHHRVLQYQDGKRIKVQRWLTKLIEIKRQDMDTRVLQETEEACRKQLSECPREFFLALLSYDELPMELNFLHLDEADFEALRDIAFDSQGMEDGELNSLEEVFACAADMRSKRAAKFLLIGQIKARGHRMGWLRAHIEIDQKRIDYRASEVQRLGAILDKGWKDREKEKRLKDELLDNCELKRKFSESITAYERELVELEALSTVR